jgi:hypothetical protein
VWRECWRDRNLRDDSRELRERATHSAIRCRLRVDHARDSLKPTCAARFAIDAASPGLLWRKSMSSRIGELIPTCRSVQVLS